MSIETEPALLKYRRTKIVATLGPAPAEEALIERLIHDGVDVFRLNMSHGDHDGHRLVYKRVRRCAAKSGRRPTGRALRPERSQDPRGNVSER